MTRKRRNAAAQSPAAQPDAPDAPDDAAAAAPRRGRTRKPRRFAGLEQRIGYTFADAKLAERALTHISALSGARNRGGNYQRLEFLGDHVLGLIVSEMLFREFAQAEEGELSRRLADLVRKETCAVIGHDMDLGPAIRLGPADKLGAERLREAVLADVCEALVGAIFLDGGYAAAASLVERFWRDRMLKPPRSLRDPKTVLQEWAQARGLPTPNYREVERTGPHHNPEFRIAVELPEHAPAEGRGRSKRAAEQAAAAALLARQGLELDSADD